MNTKLGFYRLKRVSIILGISILSVYMIVTLIMSMATSGNWLAYIIAFSVGIIWMNAAILLPVLLFVIIVWIVGGFLAED